MSQEVPGDTLGRLGPSRLWGVLVLVVVAVLVGALMYHAVYSRKGEDYDDGDLVIHKLKYSYLVSIENVSGPFEVIIPVPMKRNGDVVPSIDYAEMAPGSCELVETDHGWGLRIWGDGPLKKELTGSVDGLRNSDMNEWGFPFLSMVEGGTENIDLTEDELDLWMYSSCATLTAFFRLDYDSHRDWINWYGKVTWVSGVGWRQKVFAFDALGWSRQPLVITCQYDAN